jgi:dihydropyrimidinase
LTTYDLVLKNCKVVDVSGMQECEIAIEGGKVVKLAKVVDERADRVIDCTGKLVVPGAIDGHVHFEMDYGPGIRTADDFRTGTESATAGGVTTVIDFVTPMRGQSLVEAFEKRLKVAKGKTIVDFGLHVCVLEVNGQRITELRRLVEERGVASVKVFTAYRARSLMIDDGSLVRLSRELAAMDVLMLCHCENEEMIARATEELAFEGRTDVAHYESSRPDYAEAEAVNRIGFISTVTGVEFLVVHISSAAALSSLRALKRSGVRARGETCPHYLLFTKEVYRTDRGPLFVMAPPLRTELDREALWRGISDGTIDVISSDHAPYLAIHKLRSKDFREIPGGVQGTELIVPVLFSEGVRKGLIGLERFVELTSYNPAKIYGLSHRKGRIAVGWDADIVVIDPERKVRLGKDVLHSALNHSIYEGIEVTGYPVVTVARGEVVAEEGQITGKPGRGEYLHRKRQSANQPR